MLTSIRPVSIALALVCLSLTSVHSQDTTPPVPDIATPDPAQRILTEDTFANIAEKTLPSVVAVYVTKDMTEEIKALQSDPRFKKFFEDQPEGATPDPHEEMDEVKTSGSGVIISEDGYIVTNLHIIAEAEDNEISVVLNDDTEFVPGEVQVIARDNLMDLAILKIDPGERKLPPLPWGDSDAMRIGEWVVAIGNPLDLRGSVSKGIVSAKARQIEKVPIENLIQTDAMINPGNSGGALVNLHGELIGINMAIATQSGFFQGIGFAIPSNDARFITDQVIEHGRVRRGYIGIEMANIEDDLATALSLNLEDLTRGILVTGVVSEAPADLAGVKPYDVIIQVDGKAIQTTNDLLATVAGKAVGTSAELIVLRSKNGTLERETLSMSVAERPSQDDIWRQQESLREIQAAVATPQDDPLYKLGIEVDSVAGGDLKGIELVRVRAESPADKSGLSIGDIILEVNRNKVESESDLLSVLKEASGNSPLLIWAIQNGHHSILTLKR